MRNVLRERTSWHRFASSLLFIFLVGCDASKNTYPNTHWTVVDIHPGEMGEYLPEGLPPGTPLGYTVDYLECRRGADAICIRIENGYSPQGLDLDDRFVMTRSLDEIPRDDDLAYGMVVYYVLDDDVHRLQSK